MKILGRQAGLTLVEVLIAVAILVVGSAAIIQVYLSSAAFSEINHQDTTAMAYLTNMMEAVRSTPFSNLLDDFPDGVVDGPVGKEYSNIVGDYLLPNQSITVSYQDPDSDPLEIEVSVSWENERGRSFTRYLVTKRTR